MVHHHCIITSLDLFSQVSWIFPTTYISRSIYKQMWKYKKSTNPHPTNSKGRGVVRKPLSCSHFPPLFKVFYGILGPESHPPCENVDVLHLQKDLFHASEGVTNLWWVNGHPSSPQPWGKVIPSSGGNEFAKIRLSKSNIQVDIEKSVILQSVLRNQFLRHQDFRIFQDSFKH